jgi:hypothetical protein
MRVQELAYHVINWQARLVSFLTKWFELKHQELDEELARIRTNAAS